MSALCNMLRDIIKDEHNAPKEYKKLRAKMIGHPDHKQLIDETIEDETKHHKNMIKISEEHGCKL
jgi:rubrerythrin